MKKFIRVAALFLIAIMLLPASACSQKAEVTGYVTVQSLGKANFSMAFRKDDRLCGEVSAAMRVLAAEGKLAQLSHQWFGEDLIALEGDSGALAVVGEIFPRTLIVGYDAVGEPMCWTDKESVSGFDADMIRAVCQTLGWEVKFIAIDTASAEVELAAGNVDCVVGSFGLSGDKVSFSPEYLKNEAVLVARADSGITKAKKLKNKTLGVPRDGAVEAALQGSELAGLPANTASYISAHSCFAALDSGLCDAVLVSSTAAKYFMK